MKNTENTTKRTAPINHRPEEQAQKRAPFMSGEYQLAHIVVNACIKSSIRRGMTADKNTFITHYDEFLQIASLALIEAQRDLEQFAIMTPADLDRDPWNDPTAERISPFYQACRACGAHEKRLVRRSAKETPLEHISEGKTSGATYERAITDREAVKDWTRRAIAFIEEQRRTKAITDAQAQDMKHLMNGHPEKVKQADVVSRHLLRKLEKRGLLKTARDGHHELMHE